MNRKKKLVTLMILSLFLISGCSVKEDTENIQLQYPVFTFVYPGSLRRADMAPETEERINAVLRESVGAEIRLKGLTGSDYGSDFREMVAMNESFDIALISGNAYTENMIAGNFMDISQLIDEYGDSIVDTLSSDVVDAMKQNECIYGLPNLRDYALTTDTYVLNTEILSRNGIEIDSIESMEDLERAVETVHENEPDTLLFSTEGNTMVYGSYYSASTLEYPFGVLEDHGKGDHYINYFKTDEYKDFLKRIRSWYEKGWIKAYVQGNEVIFEKGAELVDIRYGKPDVNEEVSRYNGAAYQAISFGEDVITHGTYQLCVYSLSKDAKDPAMCMRILSEFYTSPEINQAFRSQIAAWLIPNLFLSEPHETSPQNIWNLYRQFNQNARKANDLAFNFDYSKVMKEYLEVTKIYERYMPLLENGLADVDSVLNKMNEEMDAAGMERIIEEKNRQYEIWKNS